MALSGNKVVTVVGTAEKLGEGQVGGPLLVKALPGNQGLVYLGNDGASSVASNTGLVLEAGEEVVFGFVGKLDHVYLDADLAGEGVSWIYLSI